MVKEKKTSAFMKPVQITDALAAVLGKKGPLPRTEVTQLLWVYIKHNNLQDKTNKRNINPDEKLAKVLGSKEPIDMFKMTSKISKHLKDPELASSH